MRVFRDASQWKDDEMEKGNSRVCGHMRQLSENQGRTSETRKFVVVVADSSVEMG